MVTLKRWQMTPKTLQSIYKAMDRFNAEYANELSIISFLLELGVDCAEERCACGALWTKLE